MSESQDPFAESTDFTLFYIRSLDYTHLLTLFYLPFFYHFFLFFNFLIYLDASAEYKALSKIFRHLIREENFDDLDRQTFVINTLLRQMFPKDVETREKVAYPTMRQALGISCALSSGSKRSSLNYVGGINKNDRSNDRNDKNYNDKYDNNDSKNDKNYDKYDKYDLLDTTMNSISSCSQSIKTRKEREFLNLNFVEKYESKIPTRHMNAILKDIFFNLFAEQPVVIIIEESHDLDEASWKILISLMKMPVRVFIVLTQEPIQHLLSLFTAAGSHSSIGELINPESGIYYDWIDAYINRLTNEKKSSYILLPEFTFAEVRSHLKGILKVGVKLLPVGLDQIVFNLSGGNPYW